MNTWSLAMRKMKTSASHCEATAPFLTCSHVLTRGAGRKEGIKRKT